METFVLIVQGGIGSFFLLMGGLKLSPSGGPDASLFRQVGLSRWSLRVAGGVNLLGGAGMVLGLWQPVVAFLAALLLTSYILFALHAVLARKMRVIGEVPRLVPILVICLGITLFHLPAFVQTFQ